MSKKFLSKLSLIAVGGVALLAIAVMMVNAADIGSRGAQGVSSKAKNLQWNVKFMGSTLVYTNLAGVNHHKYFHGSGYFVDGSNFFNQVLAHRFTPDSSVVFADAIIPMGVYASNGGGTTGPTASVYLESDAGGLPGSILDGPLTQLSGISSFNSGSNLVEFDCVSCPTLNAGTNYWIVAAETDPTFELTWDFSHSSDISSGNFAFNQSGSVTSGWLIADGIVRGAFEVDGN